jgi:dihydroorotase
MTVLCITLPLFFDAHAHLRQGELLKLIVADTNLGGFGRVVPMPNTDPPIETGDDVLRYAQVTREAGARFRLFPTGYVTPRTNPDTLRGLSRAGAYAIKLYPVKRNREAGTTNAHHGLTLVEFEDSARDEIYSAAPEEGLNVCIHGEDPDLPHAERELAFLPILARLAKRHPHTRFILEHVSTRAGIELVKRFANVYATITVHHLILTAKDAQANPDYDCLPQAKTEDDRRALIEAVLSGHPRIFLGTDSAPHPRHKKLVEPHAFGIYSAPVAATKIVEIFYAAGKFDKRLITGFTSLNAAICYRLSDKMRTLEFINKPWTPKAHEDPDAPLPFQVDLPIGWSINRKSLLT